MARRQSIIQFKLRAGESLINIDDYRRAARRRLPQMVWTYVDGGAEDLVALRGNRSAFSEWAVRASVLKGYGEPDLSTTVAGVPLSLPVLLSPTGFTGLSYWKGDVAAARAAERAGTRYALSSASSWTIEEVAGATREDHFFQLYPSGTSAEVASAMERAWNTGYRVLIVTVDTSTRGSREGERRKGMGMPPVLTPWRVVEGAFHPKWAFDFMVHQRIAAPALSSLGKIRQTGGMGRAVEAIEEMERVMQPTLNWGDVEWMRERWKGPMFIKGIMDPADAVHAADVGMDGVIVSNHGGRQLDHAQASIAALPAVVDAVGDRVEVLVDGGFRRGTDILKALALGARAVMIGRPYIYGLAVHGEEGVVEVVDILRDELKRALTLTGVRSAQEVDRSHLVPRHGVAQSGRG
jgi:L-lactate dehydrogenase (cytochrome)/(S)-mandelate dehydrogenase